MSDDKEKQDKYKVVDKRGVFADDEPAAAEEKSENAEAAPDMEQDQGAPKDEPRIEDAIRIAIGSIREQAFFSLGLIMSKNRRREPDIDKTLKIVGMFSKLSDKFSDRISGGAYSEADQPEPEIEDIVKFCFNILQGQVFVRMGLIANPVSGQITKDLAQAKLGIDFCSTLIDAVEGSVDGDLIRQLRAAVSEMQINFVNQSK
ncbi:MAG TPA: DUF1844 domain-containing protein [bacterium]|nr:DUF1844 domain-containing protein [bacterium]